MATQISINPSLLGITVNGDIGATTVYTNKNGRKIAFPRSPPTAPPTARQINQRTRVATASNNWTSLTKQEQQAWELMARTLSLPMTGFNVWVSLSLTWHEHTFQTLQRQANVTLTPPPPVPP